MEVGKGQHQETFPSSFQSNDFGDDDDDEDDGHFVIALDESGQENDELDDDTQDMTERAGCVNHGCGESKVYNRESAQGYSNDVTKDPIHSSKEPEMHGSVSNSKDSQPLTLRMECTAEEVVDNFESDPTDDLTDDIYTSNDTLQVPKFLASSPEIIKRLKSTLVGRASGSQQPSKSNSSPSIDCQPQTNHIGGTVLRNKASVANKKVEFTPRRYCSCIMCHGWDPSNNLPNSCDQLTSSTVLSPDPLVSNQCVVSTVNSSDVCTVSSSNTAKSHSEAVVDSIEGTHFLPTNSLFKPSSDPSVETLKQHSSQTIKNSAYDSKFTHSYLKTNDLQFTPKQVHPILKQNGSYFLLFPQPACSSQSAGHVPFVKTMIPEVDSTEGKVLVFTRDFVNTFKPDLRTVLANSKKVDLSFPGTICTIMSDGIKSSKNIRNESINEALMKVIHSHLQSNKAVCTSNSLKSPPSTKQTDAPKMLEVAETPPSSTTSAKKVSVQPSKACPESNVLYESKNSNGPSKVTITLPPPPPLVHCPVAPRSSCFSSLVSQNTYATSAPTTNVSTSSCLITNAPFPTHAPLQAGSSTTSVLSTFDNPASNTSITNASSVSRHTDHMDIEEPQEILVIPVVNKDHSNNNRSLAPGVVETNQHSESDGLYGFNGSWKNQEVLLSSNLSQKESFGENTDTKSIIFQPHKTVCEAIGSTTMPVNMQLNSSSSGINTMPTVSSSVSSDSIFRLQDSELPVMRSEPSSYGSIFPAVVQINLSSCANIVYPRSSSALSGRHRHVPPILARSSVSTKYNPFVNGTTPQRSPSLSKPLSASYSSIQNFPSQSSQLCTPVSSSTPLTQPFSHTQSGKGSVTCTENPVIDFTQSWLSDSTKKPLVSGDTAPLSSSYLDLSHANTFLSSAAGPVPCTTHLTSTKLSPLTALSPQSSSSFALQVESSSSLLARSSLQSISSSSVKLSSVMSSPLSTSSLHSTLPPSAPLISSISSSTPSVSVNGLKLKIRLGDVKNTFEEDIKSEDSIHNSSGVSCDQTEAVEEKSLTQRKESAEEMFQRCQEQAMREVYNAQFGVGNLSRSLRPARSNISFVDKSIPVSRVNGGKKKIADESIHTPKSIEENQKKCAFVPESECKRTTKTSKRRHTLDESRNDTTPKCPEYDINDFPKLREDNSILIEKTIHTSNIMAAHKVFVKFNVFSNPQSNRNFLIPFFNLGGSRVQFDNEDMEYIKKAVTEVEKEERFCARQLIFHSREGKKASFLRKETFAQTNDLSDKSYKMCSYILEGFSRDSIKNKPLPEEWEVDNKVSIEIDTAGVDSNVVFDFEESAADAVVSEVNGISQSELSANAHIEKRGLDTDNGKEVRIVPTDDCDYSKAQVQQEKYKKVEINAHSLPEMYVSDVNATFQNASSYVTNNSGHVGRKNVKYVEHFVLGSEKNDVSCRKISSPGAESSIHSSGVPEKITSVPNFHPVTHSANHPSKTLSQNASSVSAMNYTDQLKELFCSGNLNETFLHLGETNVNKQKEQALSGGDLEGSRRLSDPCVPVKQEITDDDYEKSLLPHIHNSDNSSLHETGSPSSSLSTSFNVKSEPVDKYFESMERICVRPAKTKVIGDFPRPNFSPPDTEQPINTVHFALGNANEQIIPNTMQVETDDEETLSTFSGSPVLSSDISESSDLSSSSCIDSSDEGICDENEVFTSSVGESPPLFNANFPQNTCNTKITSLVESLKQRLGENTPTILPPAFPESAKGLTKKVKKKKITRRLTKGTNPYNSVGSSKVTPLSHTVIPFDSQNIDSSHAQSNARHTERSGSSSDLLESGKRFLSITDGEQLRGESSKVSNHVHPMHGSHLQPAFHELTMKTASQEKGQIQLTKGVDNHIGKIPIDMESGSLQSTALSDCDSDSEIDVGSEIVTHDVITSNVSESKWLLPLPSFATGRSNLRDLARESEFISTRKRVDVQQVTHNTSTNILEANTSPKKFIIPIRPRNKAKVTKAKPLTPMITNPPSAASLLCQKLDIPVEPIVPKLKGKLITPFQMETSVSSKNDQSDPALSQIIPKPINPGFKPSINAIFGVPDIPKSLDSVIRKGKSCSSKLSVAKKSSAKNNKTHVARQVAKKGTAGNIKNREDVAQKKCVVLIENKFQSDISVAQNGKSSSIQGEVKKKVMNIKVGNVKVSKGKSNSSAQRIGKKKVLDTRLKSKPIDKKVINKIKPPFAKKKLGSLLVEVNRYNSLRKFAWRKYSSLEEKPYIVETGGEDKVPEVTSGALNGVENCSDDKAHGFDIGKENNDAKAKGRLGISLRPCTLQLHRLETVKWDSNEVPVKSESGTYIIKKLQDVQDNNKVSEIAKKRKKRSTFKKQKKGACKPKGCKKDIVDYYAAAIESLRKKALLLEENERKKIDELKDTPVIKQEVVELYDVNEDGAHILSDEVGLVGDELSLREVCCPSNTDECEKKSDPSEVQNSHIDKGLQEPVINNDGKQDLQTEPLHVSDNGSDLHSSSPAGTPFAKTSGTEFYEGKSGMITLEGTACKHYNSLIIPEGVSKADLRKSVEMSVRNYEGEMIQDISVRLQDQNDVEGDGVINEEVREQDNNEGIWSQDDESSHKMEGLQAGNERANNRIMEESNKDIFLVELGGKSENKEVASLGGKSYESMCDTDFNNERTSEGAAKEFGEQLELGNQVKAGVLSFNERVDSMEGNENSSKPEQTSTAPDSISGSKEELSSTYEYATATGSQRFEAKFNDSDGNILKDHDTTAPDCRFIHKDIVLGFEDTLGADTVLSKLVEEGDDDMFLLGDGDAENIGLIPDEEVERLLGLDIKGGHNDTSVVKQIDNKIAPNDTNTHTLSWELLPEKTIQADDPKNNGARNVKTDMLNVLAVDMFSEPNTNKSSDSMNNKCTNVSPSWKRILGTQALQDIQESVSSSIATSSVDNDIISPVKEKDLKPSLQTDKLKLKLCTGVLSKALKLSAEMRKTFGDVTNESNTSAKAMVFKGNCMKKGEYRNQNNSQTVVEPSTSPFGRNDFPSTSTSDRSIAASGNDVYKSQTNGLIESSSKDMCATVEVKAQVNIPNNFICSASTKATAHAIVKPLGRKMIDLAKLKMKLTPVLASAKVKSTSNLADFKAKLPSTVVFPVPEVEQSVTSFDENLHTKQKADSGATHNQKTITPLLNTEKLANILKNFKKPPNFNVSSNSSSFNPSASSSEDLTNNCHAQSQSKLEQKPATRKRRQNVSPNKDKIVDCKRKKIEGETGERSCFDCLSELAPND